MKAESRRRKISKGNMMRNGKVVGRGPRQRSRNKSGKREREIKSPSSSSCNVRDVSESSRPKGESQRRSCSRRVKEDTLQVHCRVVQRNTQLPRDRHPTAGNSIPVDLHTHTMLAFHLKWLQSPLVALSDQSGG
jgi:hypothetical protein